MSRYDELMSRVPDGESDCGCVGKDVGWDAIEAVKVLEKERDVLNEWVLQLKEENNYHKARISHLEAEIVQLEFSIRSLGY